jgi:hypothetical protein
MAAEIAAKCAEMALDQRHINAILALVTAPAGFVCVPVEPTQKMISYGLSTLGSIWSWATAKHILAIYRAMTASHKDKS